MLHKFIYLRAIMATLKALVLPHQQRADGCYPVKIRLTHNRRVRWIRTTLVARPEDLTRALKLKGYVATRADAEVLRLQRILEDLGAFEAAQMDVDDILAYLQNAERRRRGTALSWDAWCEDFIATKSPGTAKVYRTAVNAWHRYHPADCSINDLRTSDVRGFVEFISEENSVRRTKHPAAKTSAPRDYAVQLAAIFAAAQDYYNDPDEDEPVIPRRPFANVKLPRRRIIGRGKRPLTREEIQGIINARNSGDLSDNAALACDVFLLEFCLMGMNTADLYAAAPASNGELVYRRQKTRGVREDAAEMHVLIPPQALPYLERLRDPAGKRLTALYHRFPSAVDANAALREYLMPICRDLAIVPTASANSFRKAWGTIARSAAVGGDRGTVDEALNHAPASQPLLDVYAQRDWHIYADLNARVLALFDWGGVDNLSNPG